MAAAKPAQPQHAGRRARTREEDYGNRGLHRQAGTTKAESLESEGPDRESRDTRWAAKKPASRKGRPVAQGQSVTDKKAIARGAAKHR